jgi:hypothetical protein
MKKKNKKGQESALGLFIFVIVVIFALLAFWGVHALYKNYSVWSSEKTGEAELSRATWNRQISVQEAEARLESAKLDAQAEVERAKGTAEANQIISNVEFSEDYLKYLYIEGLKHNNNQIIYVPTESQLPILEATRLN